MWLAFDGDTVIGIATRDGEWVRQLYVAPGRPGPLNLLVFGGSQGARIMADISRAMSADSARDARGLF